MPANQQAIPAFSKPSRLAELPATVKASAPTRMAAAARISRLLSAFKLYHQPLP